MRTHHEYTEQDAGARQKRVIWTLVAVLAVLLVLIAAGIAMVLPMLRAEAQQQPGQAAATATPAAQVTPGSATPNAQISASNPVVDIAKAVGPSVVGVTSTQKASSGSDFFGEDMRESQFYGSGFVVTDQGHIVTNQHVIAGGTTFTVTVPGGKELSAKLIGADETTDLAVLQVKGLDLPVAPMGDSASVQVGELAVAIGNPLGKELAGTVTTGIISATQRSMRVGNTWMDVLQTDAAINPGNSGGPLVNSKGQVIGINTQKTAVAGVDEYGRTISAEGIGFAIPINEARPIINELISKGHVTRAGIGISCFEIDKATSDANGIPQGIYVDQANALGTAYRAGVREGDIITRLDNKAITGIKDFTERLLAKKIGEKVSLTIWRQGAQATITVEVMDISELQ